MVLTFGRLLSEIIAKYPYVAPVGPYFTDGDQLLCGILEFTPVFSSKELWRSLNLLRRETVKR
jgi:hypothetical protein